MEVYKINNIALINAGFTSLENISLGCQGVIIYGGDQSEIHVLCAGYSETYDKFLVSVRSFVSTSEYAQVNLIAARMMGITGNQYPSGVNIRPIFEWMPDLVLEEAPYMDMLSSNPTYRTVIVNEGKEKLRFLSEGNIIKITRTMICDY